MEHTVNIKMMLCAAAGMIGVIGTKLFGTWSIGMAVLIGFMAADYISGLMVAGIFHNSSKTEGGRLSSQEGAKGIAKKVGVLVLVGVAHGVDLMIGSDIVREAVVIAFVVNEGISVTENIGRMGVPIPERLVKAIEALQDKETK